MVSVNPKRQTSRRGDNRASSCQCFGIKCAWRHSAVIISCQNSTLKIPGILKTHCTIPLGFTGQSFFKARRSFPPFVCARKDVSSVASTMWVSARKKNIATQEVRVYAQQKTFVAQHEVYVCMCKRRCLQRKKKYACECKRRCLQHKKKYVCMQEKMSLA